MNHLCCSYYYNRLKSQNVEKEKVFNANQTSTRVIYGRRPCWECVPEYHHERGGLGEGGNEAGDRKQDHKGQQQVGAATSTGPGGSEAQTPHTLTFSVILCTQTHAHTQAHYKMPSITPKNSVYKLKPADVSQVCRFCSFWMSSTQPLLPISHNWRIVSGILHITCVLISSWLQGTGYALILQMRPHVPKIPCLESCLFPFCVMGTNAYFWFVVKTKLYGVAACVAGRPELHVVRATDWVECPLRTVTAGAAWQRIRAENKRTAGKTPVRTVFNFHKIAKNGDSDEICSWLVVKSAVPSSACLVHVNRLWIYPGG